MLCLWLAKLAIYRAICFLNNSAKSQNSFQISLDIVYWHQYNFPCLCAKDYKWPPLALMQAEAQFWALFITWRSVRQKCWQFLCWLLEQRETVDDWYKSCFWSNPQKEIWGYQIGWPRWLDDIAKFRYEASRKQLSKEAIVANDGMERHPNTNTGLPHQIRALVVPKNCSA